MISFALSDVYGIRDYISRHISLLFIYLPIRTAAAPTSHHAMLIQFLKRGGSFGGLAAD